VKIRDYLCKDCIVVDLTASTKDEVLAKLADLGVQVEPSLQKEKILSVLKEREELGSTGIGGGVAIPHGKFPELDRLLILVGRSVEGVPFDAVDNMPVHVVFLLLAPDDSATLYLKVLARVSRLLKAPGAYQRLKEASDKEAIQEVIEDIDASI